MNLNTQIHEMSAEWTEGNWNTCVILKHGAEGGKEVELKTKEMREWIYIASKYLSSSNISRCIILKLLIQLRFLYMEMNSKKKSFEWKTCYTILMKWKFYSNWTKSKQISDDFSYIPWKIWCCGNEVRKLIRLIF